MIEQGSESTTASAEPARPTGPSDAELIAACRQGNADAWDALFDKYYPVTARFVFQLSADFSHEDTEEICQETFLAVVGTSIPFRPSAFQTWLLRIASNKAKDFREKSRAAKRGGSAVHISLDGSQNEDDLPPDPPSRQPSPDVLLQSAETCRFVRQGLDRLGELCWEIIELRYYADLSYGEIASEFDSIPRQSVPV